MGMGGRDPSLRGAPRGCFSSEDYREACKLREERDICICAYCKKWSRFDGAFCSEICRISYNTENFIDLLCDECGTNFSKRKESSEILCSKCKAKIYFNNLTPDGKLEYYNCEELRYLADLKGIPKNIKLLKTLKNRLKGKVDNSDFPIKLI